MVPNVQRRVCKCVHVSTELPSCIPPLLVGIAYPANAGSFRLAQKIMNFYR